MNIENVLKDNVGYYIEVEATSEAIMKAMTYLNFMYGIEEWCTDIHVKGKKAYI